MRVIEVVMTKLVMAPRGVAAALILGALVGIFILCVIRLVSPGTSRLVAVGRVLLGIAAASLAWIYGILASPWIRMDVPTVLGFLAALGLVTGWPALQAARGRLGADNALRWLAQGVLLVLVAGLGLGTLITAGFLNLTEDRPVLVVDVTGETGSRVVRWAPPDADARVESLTTHHVVFRRPEGDVVADAWIYGDEVAVKGRVVRLSPTFNAIGIPNLFALSFAHNGYTTAERHNTMPHEAVPLPPIGPLVVHPLWRPLQQRLLAAWQAKADPGGAWGIRAATVESTYFPLVDPDGKPVARTFRLVLTPGGLTSS